ncbi:GntR family transcriptional regulator [Pseudovibrio brasiliensis]|uniref:GntR family transcriptional regulator n=1 Tax=Pseudovibrio brasiliensis TaxID=1898042 RepID=A0ABX8AN78_9HYPH|nr:GntR family transcriptional regulator [Pseudovibrio brasiliensis]QUS56534.1 GntR family transcriptional regulator [Pseudovibrio brasiliensis]
MIAPDADTKHRHLDALFAKSNSASETHSVKRTPQEEIYFQLREDICLLRSPPGTVLREGKIASDFGISRTPIREVMHRLQFDGLVTAKNGVGYIVTSVDFDYYIDAYALRIRLAETIGQLSPREITPADVAEAEKIKAEAALLLENFDLHSYWTLNHDLNQLIYTLIGNRALQEVWNHIYFKVARIWYSLAPYFAEEVAEYFYAEASDVVRALKGDDIEALGFSQRNYISRGLKRVQKFIEEQKHLEI